jgi:lipopolysaccharide/colanic/teichoic acid biosynthesis glycosyltransferase
MGQGVLSRVTRGVVPWDRGCSRVTRGAVQVGDRNATGFAERVATDVHYVRNWSPWLDVWVLARTFGVVVGGTGS